MRKILSRGKEENDYYVPPLPWETTGASFSPITCFVRINCGLIEQSRGKKNCSVKSEDVSNSLFNERHEQRISIKTQRSTEKE